MTVPAATGRTRHHRPPFARQVCAGVSQPARPGRGTATVGPSAQVGGRFGGPADHPDPVAPGTVAGAAAFPFRYDHRAPILPRMNPAMADLLPVDGAAPIGG
ncbi:hypothetical protein [Micromonospora sp. WMMD710]|uniref:hypothetical protein n=1 Tax=Micromonospora sp. WMMD710 TaxID=3016085 RepID=UPI00241751AF|nr:hypothetical protein [Micromonospora sp. WMMD710]MDG4761277.1 hypothetical protein [Micromonospora sp. WMMD710]